jgi:2-polyprenyl-3-methyl-5-hydroxy-6-metoxy-1,4-benzoquinol methylase
MFSLLQKINRRPEPFGFYTAKTLWDDPHISQQMLSYHLNESVDLASRNKIFINQSLQWIIARFSIAPGSHVCDFGCGPGLYTLPLALTGASVTGLDFSRNSIKYALEQAEQNNVAIKYELGDYLEFESDEKYDLITMIMCDFCVLSPAQRKIFLRERHELLKPGGATLLDGYTLNAFQKRKERTAYAYNLMDGFWSPEDYYGFLNVFKYPRERVVLDQYTIIEKCRTWQAFNWLQYYSPETLLAEFQSGQWAQDY